MEQKDRQSGLPYVAHRFFIKRERLIRTDWRKERKKPWRRKTNVQGLNRKTDRQVRLTCDIVLGMEKRDRLIRTDWRTEGKKLWRRDKCTGIEQKYREKSLAYVPHRLRVRRAQYDQMF